MKKSALCLIVVLFLLSANKPVHAILGVGLHWGLDMTLSMDDATEPILFTSGTIQPSSLLNSITIFNAALPNEIKIDSFSTLVTNNLTKIQKNSPILIKRTDWRRSNFNIGGKAYLDLLPFVDAVEVSFNLGAWEYKGSVRYPTGELQKTSFTATDVQNFMNTGDYSIFMKMQDFDLSIGKLHRSMYLKHFGITQTPFTRMHFDLSVRKTIIGLPPLINIIKITAGGGPSLHFASPLLTPEFVRQSVQTIVTQANNNVSTIAQQVITESVMKQVLEGLVEQSKNPVFGMNIVAGATLKLPVIPFGFYVDAKFAVPFGQIGEDIDLGGYGLIFNGGILFGL